MALHGPKRASQLVCCRTESFASSVMDAGLARLIISSKTWFLLERNLSQPLQRGKPHLGVIGTRPKFTLSNGNHSRAQLVTRSDSDPQSLPAYGNPLRYRNHEWISVPTDSPARARDKLPATRPLIMRMLLASLARE